MSNANECSPPVTKVKTPYLVNVKEHGSPSDRASNAVTKNHQDFHKMVSASKARSLQFTHP